MSNETAPNGEWFEEVDLRGYLRPLLEHKWSVLALTLSIPLLAALATLWMTPVYQATATLLIDARPANVVDIEAVVDAPRDREYFRTQQEILRSHGLLEQVAQRLALVEHPEFEVPDDDGTRNWRRYLPLALWSDRSVTDLPVIPLAQAGLVEVMQDLVAVLADRLTVEPVNDTQLVRVGFDAHDPNLAAAIVNALCELYIDYERSSRLQATVAVAGMLGERLGDLRDRLDRSERALQAYREREQLLDIAGVRTLAARRLEQLTNQLLDAGRRLTEAESLRRQVLLVGAENHEALLAIPLLEQDPLLQNLRTAEAGAQADYRVLSRDYGERHPRLVAARVALEEARVNTRTQIERLVARIEQEYAIARANHAALESALNSAKEDIRQINRKEAELNLLEREAASNRQLYELFMNRANETTAVSDIQAAGARVVDAALVPLQPYKPDRERLVLLGLMVGLMLGVAWAYLREFFNLTLKRVDDIEPRLGATALGFIPRIRLSRRERRQPGVLARYFATHPDSGFAEAIRTIRTGVLLSGLDAPHKVIVVTSCHPGEGKSTVAMNLAHALSDPARVLLIDADMRRPTLGRVAGLSGSVSGLAQFVAGMDEPAHCLHRLEGSGVTLMPAGILPPNPLELLSSRRFGAMLEELRGRFDYLIIDSPPALAVSDALVLASHASAVLFVVQAGSTAFKPARTALARLRKAGAPVAGVILNQVHLRHHPEYQGYGYHHA